MKKILSLFGILLGAFVFLGCTSVQAQETTTTLSPTSSEVTYGDRTFTYTSVDDLIDQMYEIVYADLYADLYAEFSEDLFVNIDEEIYDAVVANLQGSVDTGNISVIIDANAENLGVTIVNAFQDSIDEVVELAGSSVIGITNYLGTEAKSLGSGVIYYHDTVANRYYFITNEHVVKDGDNYKVVFEDGTSIPAQLIGKNATIDIAILSFSGAVLPYPVSVSPLGNSSLLNKGTIAIAVGNPEGYDFYGSVTLGVVSGTNRFFGTDDPVPYIQHDAAINAGNSGGPLYNLQGQVIGINVSKYAETDIEGMGFAIPVNVVKTVIETFAPDTLG